MQTLKQKQADMDARGVDKNSEQYRKLQREIITTESKLKTFKGQLRSIGNVNFRVAGEQMKAFGQKVTAAGQSLRTISRYAAVATGAIGALAVASGKWADDLNTLSKQYSISTRELQVYGAAAKLVDVDVNDIAASHVKLTRNMSSALSGSKRQAEAFEQLGIQLTDANGEMRDGDTVWQETIAALGKMRNETERDAIAMTLMGKSANQLNPLIEDGGETYKRVSDTMKKYGLDFIDQKTLDDAQSFNDALDTIKAIGLLAFQSIGTALAGYLAPALENVVGAVGKFANWISQLDPQILTIIATIGAVVAALSPVLIIIGAISTGIGTLLTMVGTVVGAVTAPILAIVAAVAAVVAIIGLAYARSEEFRNAVNTLIGELIQIVKPAIMEIVAAFKQLFGVLVEVTGEIAGALAPVITALTPVITAVARAIITFFVARIKMAIKTISLFARGISSAVKIFSSGFSKIVSVAKSAVNRLKSIFNSVKNAITHPIETAVNLVRSAISRIKNILQTKISIPKIKLPHIKISGKLSLNPPQVPKLSVEWYKTGGIFNSPTIAGIGEAGPEAVIPLDTLWKKLDAIALAAASGGGESINIYATPGMDINQLTSKVEQVLVKRQRQREKAWG